MQKRKGKRTEYKRPPIIHRPFLPLPINEPLNRRILWLENAIRKLGDRPHLFPTTNRGLIYDFLMIQYEEIGGPLRKVKEMFRPRLKMYDIDLIPESSLKREINLVFSKLGSHGIDFWYCDHMDDRDIYIQLSTFLDQEDIGPRESMRTRIMLNMECEECIRDWAIDLGDDLSLFCCSSQ